VTFAPGAFAPAPRPQSAQRLRWEAVKQERGDSERRLVRAIGAVVFVDTMFYAAIAPLLPTLAHELHLSKLSAGVIVYGSRNGSAVLRANSRPRSCGGPLKIGRLERSQLKSTPSSVIRFVTRTIFWLSVTSTEPNWRAIYTLVIAELAITIAIFCAFTRAFS